MLLLLAARFGRRPAMLPAIPIGVAALGALVWSNDLATSRVTSLSEIHTGDRVARFVALLQLQGNGAGVFELLLPAELGTPLASTLAGASTVEYGQEDSPVTRLTVNTQLLSRHEFELAGTTPTAVPLTLLVDERGPEIVNLSAESSPSAILAWKGERYQVPMLAPKARWRPGSEPSAWERSPGEQLLRARIRDDNPALLLPFSLSDAGLLNGTADARGWLLMRATASEKVPL